MKMSDVPKNRKLFFWDGQLWLRWDDFDDLPGPEGEQLRIKIVCPQERRYAAVFLGLHSSVVPNHILWLIERLPMHTSQYRPPAVHVMIFSATTTPTRLASCAICSAYVHSKFAKHSEQVDAAQLRMLIELGRVYVSELRCESAVQSLAKLL